MRCGSEPECEGKVSGKDQQSWSVENPVELRLEGSRVIERYHDKGRVMRQQAGDRGENADKHGQRAKHMHEEVRRVLSVYLRIDIEQADRCTVSWSLEIKEQHYNHKPFILIGGTGITHLAFYKSVLTSPCLITLATLLDCFIARSRVRLKVNC